MRSVSLKHTGARRTIREGVEDVPGYRERSCGCAQKVDTIWAAPQILASTQRRVRPPVILVVLTVRLDPVMGRAQRSQVAATGRAAPVVGGDVIRFAGSR